MAAASQAVPGEFDSRHLLQTQEAPLVGAFVFGKLAYIDESRGWSRFAGAKRFAKIGMNYDRLDGKGRH